MLPISFVVAFQANWMCRQDTSKCYQKGGTMQSESDNILQQHQENTKFILHLDYVDVKCVLSIQGWLRDTYNQELDVPSIE